MLSGLAVFFAVSAVVIAVHKLGHYLAGRWLVGIPAADIRIVIASLPQYVALRDGDRWTSPTNFDLYLTAYHQYDPDLDRAVAFFAAGELAQTAAVVGLAAVGVVGGVDVVAQSAVLASVMLVGYHLIADLALNFHMGHPTGDISALWYHSPLTAGVFSLVVAVPHAILYMQLI
jgi:membrane-associated protease RseP (regulator of RpoE activity)